MQESQGIFNSFCPIAQAALLIEPRWTILVLAEIDAGSSRFSDIQRGVPGMSPSLLSRRLMELVGHGLVHRDRTAATAQWRYRLTRAGATLMPVIQALGLWAHENLDLDPRRAPCKVDDRLLMWNIRRKFRATDLREGRTVIEFLLRRDGQPDKRYWMVLRPGSEADLCSIDPKFDVELYALCDLAALAAAWMGHSTFDAELAKGRIQLIGDRALARNLGRWMVRSSFAGDGIAAE